MLFVEDGKMGECLLAKLLRSEALKTRWRQCTETSVFQRGYITSLWCRCAWDCPAACTRCLKTETMYFPLFVRCCLFIVLAFLPVEPPDGVSSRNAASGCERMLQSLSMKPCACCETTRTLFLFHHSANIYHKLYCFITCSVSGPMLWLCLFIHRATGVPRHMEGHSEWQWVPVSDQRLPSQLR